MRYCAGGRGLKMEIKKYEGKKEFVVSGFKEAETDGVLRISGYANNKHIADRYGDIPTEYNRSYVYELEEYRRNPVLLMDHDHDVSHMVGSVTNIFEDEKGLYFEAEISNSDLPIIKHARQLIKEGHLKTVSIGGVWLYEDLQNPSHLTLAKIFEISLVAVPADTYAVFEPKKPAEPAKTAPRIDLRSAFGKLAVFEMKQKISKFEAKSKQPDFGQGANNG